MCTAVHKSTVVLLRSIYCRLTMYFSRIPANERRPLIQYHIVKLLSYDINDIIYIIYIIYILYIAYYDTDCILVSFCSTDCGFCLGSRHTRLHIVVVHIVDSTLILLLIDSTLILLLIDSTLVFGVHLTLVLPV